MYGFRQLSARRRLEAQDDIRLALSNNTSVKAARSALAEVAYADDKEMLGRALFEINQ